MDEQTFTMTQEQYDKLLNSCKPVPAMWIGGPPPSVQDNANRAWQALGDELGFVWDTVRPLGNDPKVFAAVSKAAPQAAKEMP